MYFIFYVLVQHKLDLIKDKFTVYIRFLATLIARKLNENG